MVFISSSILINVAVGVATCITVLYIYVTQKFRYWKRRGVPYIPPTSILGNLGEWILQRESYWETIKRAYESNPDQPVVGLYSGRSPFLVIRDLNLIRAILVSDAHAFLDRPIELADEDDPVLSRSIFFMNGKKWRHMRIKLTPTFTSGKIKRMFPLINECGKQLLPCIDHEMTKGKCSVKDTVARYSTDVIASCAFGVNANSLEDPNCEFRTTTRKIFEKTKFEQLIISLTFIVPWLVKLLRLKAYDDNTNAFIRKTFWDVVDYRKHNNVMRNDFVDILMQIRNKGEIQVENEKDLQEITQDSKYLGMEQSKTDKFDIKLEDDDFIAQALTFIAAGFETSSSVISFTLYELALNPDIQNKLRREIIATLGKHNVQVTYDALAEMSYLDMVVSEAMRKYPTLPTLERVCVQDYKITGTDIIIEKDTPVTIPVLGIHLDPAIYAEPDKFDPQRFSPENRNRRSKFAHIPFGEGPRICIGMRFGQMQVKTALIHILACYEVVPCADTPQPPLQMDPTASVNSPKEEIILAFQKIK